MNLKKIVKVFTSKSVGTGPSSREKKNLPGSGLTKVEKHCFRLQQRCKNVLVNVTVQGIRPLLAIILQ